LPVIVAQPYLQIGPGRPFPTVEGACFDREGRLLVGHREAPWSDVLSIDPDTGDCRVFYHDEDASIIGLACHRDGRVFCADIHGRLVVLSPEGEFQCDLLAPFKDRAFKPNDLCFDNRGNIYFSDFVGTPAKPTGAIYRLDAAEDYSVLHVTADELCTPNGVSFSPDFSILWTSESLRNDVTRVAITPDGNRHPHFSAQLATYHNSGYPHVDSNSVDADGNVYQAIMEGGRAIVLNDQGIPTHNILLSDRDEGLRMKTPNLAIRPGKSEGYMVACGEGGAWVYKFDALAPSAPLYANM
jgi:lactonase